ncbi:hypothetical protein SAY87_011487 [Trapa incisa]|uniref:BZIP domain-containing protein n=2 Tax=Trapa TaxID=22665 RepID=A0AAN7REH9_TRANT|nr:hypothetical protein SAY87_011487 [Trapa incisa]KAK4795063.1 hypothetical protein SAY86_013057 [Trapa natans]
MAMNMIIDQMPDAPQQRRNHHHRRAHSDTSFRFLDDDLLLFDPSDIDLDISSLDPLPPPAPAPPRIAPSPGPYDSDDSSSSNPRPRPSPAVPTPARLTPTPGPYDSSDDGSSSNPRPRPCPPVGHFRSLSVDSDLLEVMGLTLTGGDEKFGGGGKQPATPHGEKRSFYRHSNSMDSSTTASFEVESEGAKKALAAEKLAELSLIDPKRAKRILANRQSAARSKERKIQYTSELEKKVQTLQTEATTLSAQVTILQRDTDGLTVENRELKLRLQALEQQAQLQDALNEKLREEVQRLKMAATQLSAVNGNPFSQVPPQFPPAAGHNFVGNSTMQPQQHSSSNGLPHQNFLDYNNRAQ